MGNWKIVIEGIGSHHNNGYEGDANEIGKALVERLARQGQTVTAARFEHGLSGNYDNLMADAAVIVHADGVAPGEAPEPTVADFPTPAPREEEH